MASSAAPTPLDEVTHRRRTFALAVLPQALQWALIMTASTRVLARAQALDAVREAPLGVLAALGEPAPAAAIAGSAMALGALLAWCPGGGRGRTLALQGLGLAFTVALAMWAQVTLVCMPLLGGIYGRLAALHPLAWALLPVALVALLLVYLHVMAERDRRPFPVGELAHLFVLVAVIELPFVPWGLDPKLPIDVAVLWSGDLGACFFGLTAGLLLERAWRRRTTAERGFGPWFIFAVSALTALAVSRRLSYICAVCAGLEPR